MIWGDVYMKIGLSNPEVLLALLSILVSPATSPALSYHRETERTGFIIFQMPALFAKGSCGWSGRSNVNQFCDRKPHGDDNRQLLTANRHLPSKENGCFSSGLRIFSWQMWIKSTCPISWIHPYKPCRCLFIWTPFKSKILGFPPPQPQSSLLPASHPTECDLREHNSVLLSSVARI